MKLIVGLGNPGEKYEHTRHNVGFDLVDNLNDKLQISNVKQTSNFKFQSKFNTETIKIDDVILAKPQTFMNNSGRAVRSVADYYQIKPANICIAHDDLDIELGKYKIELARGPKIHNGVNSVEQSLGTKDFWRIRIGVDNRTKELRQQISGRDYVLMKMSRSEKELLIQTYSDIIKDLSDNHGIEYRV